MLETLFTFLLISSGVSLIAMIVGMHQEWDSTPLIMLILAFSVIGVFTVGIIGAVQYDTKLVNQCVEDGRKEYECRAMLRNGNRVTPMPVIIPVR